MAGWIARFKDARRRKKASTGDSPEKLAEHHTPKRDWGERAIHALPGGQRHSNFKGDRD
jgi:hypothetical protein